MQPPTDDKEQTMPAVETGIISGFAKWIIGLVLIPYLWYERKRMDKLMELLADKYMTKEEIKEQIELRQAPIIEKLDLIYDEIIRIRKNG